MIRSPVFARSEDAIAHGFFTREGGVSRGLYASLNCGLGSGDDRDCVIENRRRCASGLGAGASTDPLTVYQVHGTAVAEVDAPWAIGGGPRADALVTRRKGVVLGILTADCVPVLLADQRAGVIGAAHAGWKGAKAGVIEAVIEAMVRLGAQTQSILACVGPAIAAESYEVGDSFRADFVSDRPDSARYFSPGPSGRPHFDLPAFVQDRLEANGVARTDRIRADTYADPDRFFSYRRSCHRSEADYGRQLSAIMLY